MVPRKHRLFNEETHVSIGLQEKQVSTVYILLALPQINGLQPAMRRHPAAMDCQQ
jgi:hypothetical protein